ERPPPRTGVETDYREAGFGQPAGQGAATSACADNGEIDDVVVAILTHRNPAADLENIRRTAILAPRGLLCVIRHGHFPGGPRSPAQAWLQPLPRGRGGENPSGQNPAGSPGRQSRSRSRRSGARNRG